MMNVGNVGLDGNMSLFQTKTPLNSFADSTVPVLPTSGMEKGYSMNLLQRISFCLLKLAAHKKLPLSRTHDSIATPLGHVPYRDTHTMHRDVNTRVKLEDGVERARTRCYVPRGDE